MLQTGQGGKSGLHVPQAHLHSASFAPAESAWNASHRSLPADSYQHVMIWRALCKTDNVLECPLDFACRLNKLQRRPLGSSCSRLHKLEEKHDCHALTQHSSLPIARHLICPTSSKHRDVHTCMVPCVQMFPCKVIADRLNFSAMAAATSLVRAMTIFPNAFSTAG